MTRPAIKHNQSRPARSVFRIGVAVCSAMIIVWVASYWRSLNVAVPGWRFIANCGSVWLFRDGVSLPGVWTAPTMQGFVPWVARRVGGPFVAPVCAYKMWLVLFVAMIPTLLAWQRLGRKYPPAHCRQCGYNLKGNVTGKCSECGTEIEAKHDEA